MYFVKQQRSPATRVSLALLVCAAIGLGFGHSPAAAVELIQYFPAVPAGQTAPPAESGWKISWEVLEAGTHAYGGSAVWEIQSVEFMKGRKAVLPSERVRAKSSSSRWRPISP